MADSISRQDLDKLKQKYPNIILDKSTNIIDGIDEEFNRKLKLESPMNIKLNYPYNDEYEYVTMLHRINLDTQRVKDIKEGRGFIISAPQGIKKDVKNQDGIFSRLYGSNSTSDLNSFETLYRCNCGAKHGVIHHGEYCEFCDSYVRYIGDDVSKVGYLVLKPNYFIIHPNMYRTLEAFIGVHRLNRIIEPVVEVDSDGRELPIVQTRKDEPFKGIGILELKRRYKEILDFYLNLYPQKKNYYDDLIEQIPITFTHSIAVYSALLRPSKIDDASLRYEATNDSFNMLANLVYKINRDKLRMDRKRKEKLRLLYDTQVNLNELYTEIKKILAKKRGDIRSAIGGRYAFSARCVIKQDITLRADEVKLPYHALVELLQQVIINILTKTYNITYSEAYKKWFKAQLTFDQVVYDIIDGLIKDNKHGGLPMFINRNPTIAYGGIPYVKCVGINMDYTMSLSLLVLKLLAADFDGDTLTALYLYNEDVIKVAEEVLSPNAMIISRNDGRLNDDMLFSRDVMINANALRGICDYSQDEMNRIKWLQQQPDIM